MTIEERNERRKKEQDLCILAHTIAEKAVGYEGITYSRGYFWTLANACRGKG